MSKGNSHPVFYGDLVYKLRRVKDTTNFISSGSKIVKRLRRRQYDPVIIERTIGLVLGPCTALYIPFLSKIEKVLRGIRGEKSSKDMASSRNLVSTIGALASLKMGDGTRCPEG